MRLLQQSFIVRAYFKKLLLENKLIARYFHYSKSKCYSGQQSWGHIIVLFNSKLEYSNLTKLIIFKKLVLFTGSYYSQIKTESRRMWKYAKGTLYPVPICVPSILTLSTGEGKL